MDKEKKAIATEDEMIVTSKSELVKLFQEMSIFNVSMISDKLNEIESSLENKINKIICENYCASAINIIGEVKKIEEEERKKIYDRRLRNAKYLFRNYNNLIKHYETAVYIENELDDESLTDIYDFIDEDNETIMIQSIYRSKKRTKIMITHIKVCIDTFIQDAYNSGKPGKITEADVVKHCILDNKTVEETAEIMDYNPRSISRIKKKVIEQDLAILIFGVDAIRLDK